jgi:hypothetical protein
MIGQIHNSNRTTLVILSREDGEEPHKLNVTFISSPRVAPIARSLTRFGKTN